MELIRLNEDSLFEYEDVIAPDAVDCIGRQFHSGLAVTDGKKDPELLAYMVWEYIRRKDASDNEAVIIKFFSKDEKAGRMLAAAFDEELSKERVKRCTFYFEKEDADAASVLSEAGFVTETREGPTTMVSLSDCASLSVAKSKTPDYVVPIEDLMIRQFRNGIDLCVRNGRRGIFSDLEYLPMSWFDEEISGCVFQDDEVKGFLLVTYTAGGELVPALLFDFETDATKNLLHMIAFTIRAAVKKYPPDTRVLLVNNSEMSEALIKKLFPMAKPYEILFGERVQNEG